VAIKTGFRANGTVSTSVELRGIYALASPTSGKDGYFDDAVAIRNRTERIAKAIAPSRTGRLQRGLKSNLTPQGLNLYISVYATSYYARWVIEGTSTPIQPTRATHMKVPPHKRMDGLRGQDLWEMDQPVLLYRKVRGQRPNNFLDQAMRIVLHQRGLAR